LDSSYFYRKTENSKGSTPLNPDESLGVLLEHTGLKHTRIYFEFNSIYIYLPGHKCYVPLTTETLSIIVARLFSQLSLPAQFRSNTYLDTLVKCAFVRPGVAHLGNPQQDIAFGLVAMSNGVLDVNTGKLLDSCGPERSGVNYLPYA
jgi:hypothetical protein